MNDLYLQKVTLLLAICICILCPVIGIFSLYHSLKAKRMYNKNDAAFFYKEIAVSYKLSKIAVICLVSIVPVLYLAFFFFYKAAAR